MKTSCLNISKPSTAFLIVTNFVVLLIYMLYDIQNAFQMYIVLPEIIVLLVLSSVYHVILWLFTRNKKLKSVVKISLYLLPVIMLVLLGILLSKILELPNQQPKLVSCDSKYTMYMDMKDNRWVASIYDEQGKKLYSDDNSDFHGQFNVYWTWDDDDRLWLYNSDDSLVYYWIRARGEWQKICWSTESDKNVHDFYPPKALYPKYK